MWVLAASQEWGSAKRVKFGKVMSSLGKAGGYLVGILLLFIGGMLIVLAIGHLPK
jgi:hypothetical protein